jgi:hypothetical protein
LGNPPRNAEQRLSCGGDPDKEAVSAKGSVMEGQDLNSTICISNKEKKKSMRKS